MMENLNHSGFECSINGNSHPKDTAIHHNEDVSITLVPPIEVSVTKDMATKMHLDLSKTQNVEPDINHWYAKIVIFNRKRYVLAVNTMTRFAVILRLNAKTFCDEFKTALKSELNRYEINDKNCMDANVILSLGNNKASTAQLNNVGQEIEYVFHKSNFAAYESDYADLFAEYNKHNLGTAGNNKKMTFALDEMKKLY